MRVWGRKNPDKVARTRAKRAAQIATLAAPDIPCPYCESGTMRPRRQSCTADACYRAHRAAKQREFQRRYKESNGRCYNHERFAATRTVVADRRRARMAGVPFSPVERLAIFERDGWTCWLCSDFVDPNLRYPNPMSASLDHVVPISLDGPHTEENARCAHLLCNARRGNRAA